ncbi:MAG: hypothetical protein AAF663_00465 [Planctomycetota bacterium]
MVDPAEPSESSPAPMGDPVVPDVIETSAGQQPVTDVEIRGEVTRRNYPFPMPDDLERYEKLVPGFAKAVHDEFLANGKHTRSMEQKSLALAESGQTAYFAGHERGQWLGFACVVLALIAGVVIVLVADTTGGEIVGGLLSVSGLAGLVAAFLGKSWGKAQPPDVEQADADKPS